MTKLSTLDILRNFNVHVRSNAPLSEYTTFRLGGPCPLLVTCQTPQDLISITQKLIREKIPFILIGGGSNLVVSDEGLDVVVIRYVADMPRIQKDGTDLIVSGSSSLDDLALYAAQNALEGINYASGIPGTVGGAIVGNAGAFGKQVGDILKSVKLISSTGAVREAFPSELGFTYRNSKLKETGDIVVEARFGLHPGKRETLLRERLEILAVRHEKHPDLKMHPCAGSFFRNIEPTSKAAKRQAAGWFLEQAGGKSLHAGGATIFDKHANIIVKGQNCKAQDVYDLSKQMQSLVSNAYGFNLVREVRFVGKFNCNEFDARHLIW